MGHALLARTLLHGTRIDHHPHRDLARRGVVAQHEIAHAVRQRAEDIIGIVWEIATVARPQRIGLHRLRCVDGLGLLRRGGEHARGRNRQKPGGDPPGKTLHEQSHPTSRRGFLRHTPSGFRVAAQASNSVPMPRRAPVWRVFSAPWRNSFASSSLLAWAIRRGCRLPRRNAQSPNRVA